MAKTREWWELPEEEIEANPEAQKARHKAYNNALHADDDGRAVLFDIRRQCYGVTGFQSVPENTALACLALIELYQHIRRCCGITDEMEKEVIDAEAQIS